MYNAIPVVISLTESRNTLVRIIPWNILEEIQLKELIKQDRLNEEFHYMNFIKKHVIEDDQDKLKNFVREEFILLAVQIRILSKGSVINVSYSCDNDNAEDGKPCPMKGNPVTTKYDLNKDVSIESNGIFEKIVLIDSLPAKIEFRKPPFMNICEDVEPNVIQQDELHKNMSKIASNITSVTYDGKILESEFDISDFLFKLSPIDYEPVYEAYVEITNHRVRISKKTKCPVCSFEYTLFMENFDFFL